MDEKKELTRREFLGLTAATAALALLPGCGSDASHAEVMPGSARRAVPGWGYAYTNGVPVTSPVVSYEGETVLFDPNQQYAVAQQPAYYAPQPTPTYAQASYIQPAQPQPAYRQPAPVVQQPRRAPAVAAPGDKLRAVSRQSWAVTPPNPQKMRAMNGVSRITVHHEGSKANNDSTPAQVAATLQRIQGQHRKRMGAGDIGYHFIIDRTGTIWQGRDWRYQGAHTSGQNAHNLGVMLLGNFEIQQPTGAQLSSMRNLVLSLARMYNLDVRKSVYAHNDFGNTQCPGKNLKGHVTAFKSLR